MEEVQELYNGLIIYRQGNFGYRHYGVVIYDYDRQAWSVMDNFPKEGCRILPLESFRVDGETIYYENNPEVSHKVAMSRYREVCDRKFRAADWNCEHFANYIAGRAATSKQVVSAVALGILILMA